MNVSLVFEEDREAIEEILANSNPVFVEKTELAVNNGGKMNFLIEGDNLAALKLLEKTYSESIDLIIIDPPYNRRKNDLRYSDNFADGDDLFGHGKWLSFMKKRLVIAQKLLNKDGYIFINIDENELAQLKLLCDSIFGENNFVGMYMWEKTATPPALSNKVRKKLEFILCYAKSLDKSRQFSQGVIDGIDAPLLNTGNGMKTLIFPKETVKFKIPDGTYESVKGDKIKLLNPVIVKNGTNENELVMCGEFKWLQETVEKEVAKGTTFLVRSKKFLIRYQRDNNDKVKIPTNLLNGELGIGTNETATKELEELGLPAFDYPKPVSLYSFLIKMVNCKRDMTVLDFFAGSGTTGHAVLSVNNETGSNHNFILCTNNQDEICRGTTYERIKRVIERHECKASLKYHRIEFI